MPSNDSYVISWNSKGAGATLCRGLERARESAEYTARYATGTAVQIYRQKPGGELEYVETIYHPTLQEQWAARDMAEDYERG